MQINSVCLLARRKLTVILVECLLLLLALSGEHEVGVELLVLLKVPLHGRRELGIEHLHSFFLHLSTHFSGG